MLCGYVLQRGHVMMVPTLCKYDFRTGDLCVL